jgi:hypothetical protein
MLYMSFNAYPQIKKLQNKKQREVIRRIIKEASLGSKFAVSVIAAIVASVYTAGLASEAISAALPKRMTLSYWSKRCLTLSTLV